MGFAIAVLAMLLVLPVAAEPQNFSQDLPATVPDPTEWPDPSSLHMKGMSGEMATPVDKAVVAWLVHEGICKTDQSSCDFFIHYEVFVHLALDGTALEHQHRYIVQIADGRMLEGLAYSYKDDQKLHDVWIRRSGLWESRTSEVELNLDGQLIEQLDRVLEKAKYQRQRDLPNFYLPGSPLIANGVPHGTPFLLISSLYYGKN